MDHPECVPCGRAPERDAVLRFPQLCEIQRASLPGYLRHVWTALKANPAGRRQEVPLVTRIIRENAAPGIIHPPLSSDAVERCVAA